MHKATDTILVVDDAPENLSLLAELLHGAYTVRVAASGERALEVVLTAPRPDLILLDVMMPGLDGFEVCRQLQADDRTKHIPVIFLTARTEPDDEQRGLEAGAVDYISKPINPAVVLARVTTHLTLKHAADFLRDKNAFLETEISRRVAEATVAQDAAIEVVTSLAETRDSETGQHIRRTQNYVKRIAEHLRTRERFRPMLSAEAVHTMYRSAPLHDIGKVGVPDAILLKPGRLTPEEFEIMKSHTVLGCRALERAERQLGHKVDFLQMAKEIALSHQEKWDGSGYPHALAGEQIPLAARVMAVADVYDALISSRPYKKALSHDAALEIMRDGRGTHFDPDILDGFLEISSSIKDIAANFADS